MKQYKHERLIPLSKTVEGHLSFSESKMSFDLVRNLLAGGASATLKCVLTKNEKELFIKFYQEQQRLNRLAEIKFLRSYLTEQKATIKRFAAFIKKRDAKELKEYGRLPMSMDFGVRKTIPSAAACKVTNDPMDLYSKIDKLDRMISNCRSIINSYEMADFNRHESTIKRKAKDQAELSAYFRKKNKLSKVA